MDAPIYNTRTARWNQYVYAFLITAAIFATAVIASNYFNDRRIQDIRTTQDDISTQILSLQTQFDLLQERSCADIAENTVLPQELQTLASRLSYMEAQGDANREEVVRLKRLYSLLEIKDYLLMKQFSQKCGLKPVFIFYFYSNEGDCDDCERQGYVLTALAREYPQLRIYSFDYNLDVSALRTLRDLNDIRDELPALIINGNAYYGFKSIEDIEKILPQLSALKKAATSTPEKK